MRLVKGLAPLLHLVDQARGIRAANEEFAANVSEYAKRIGVSAPEVMREVAKLSKLDSLTNEPSEWLKEKANG